MLQRLRNVRVAQLPCTYDTIGKYRAASEKIRLAVPNMRAYDTGISNKEMSLLSLTVRKNAV